MTQNHIDRLRVFFRLTNAAFGFKNILCSLNSSEPIESKMQILHRDALEEVEKEKPDLQKIHDLLLKMEIDAQSYHNEKDPNFPKGGMDNLN